MNIIEEIRKQFNSLTELLTQISQAEHPATQEVASADLEFLKEVEAKLEAEQNRLTELKENLEAVVYNAEQTIDKVDIALDAIETLLYDITSV